MATHPMSLLGRYWRRVQSWWEEYYSDNPIVWLLYRQMRYTNLLSFSSKAQQIEKELRQAQQARDLDAIQSLQQVRSTLLRGNIAPQSFWKRSDRVYAVLLWGLALLTAHLIYQQGWHPMWQSTLKDFSLIWIVLGIVLGLLLFAYGTLPRGLLLQERLQGTDQFLWLTRLEGRHLVLGAITALVLGHQVRPYFIFFAPFVWLMGTLWQDSVSYGLWFAVLAGWWCTTFAVFWQIVSIFTLPASSNNLTNLIIYWLYGAFTLVVLCFPIVGFVFGTFFREAIPQVVDAPVWMWGFYPAWWFSLPAHAGIVLLYFAIHPLWGIPQGLLCLGMAYGLLPFAIRFAERARLLAEPTPLQEEGW